jgi:hypothetical protein
LFLGLVPFGGGHGGYVELLGMLQLNVCAKCFIERFIGFLPSAWPIGNGLFDADGFMALRALAEAVTGTIDLVPWPKPTSPAFKISSKSASRCVYAPRLRVYAKRIVQVEV